MSEEPLGAADYPLAEKRPGRVVGQGGKSLDALTLESAMAGGVGMDDLRITPGALLQQAQIARSVGRAALAANFERAAEMARVPQDEVMQIYEMLRPGRARSAEALFETAARLETEFEAPRLAAFVREAAALYQRRGLFRTRY